MSTRWIWVLSFSVATVSGLQACGSDGGGGRIKPDNDGSAGDDGTGGKSTGGRSGMGGSSGAGGMMLACNTAPCDQQLAGISGLLGTFGGAVPITIKSCCVNATTCGIDTSGVGALLGGIMLPGCIDPNGIINMPPNMTCDATPAAGVAVTDAGVIRVPGTDPDVQLDKACPCIAPVDQSTMPPATAFTMPGCCRPNGTCGGSTHTLQGAGTDVALACTSYQEIGMAAALQFGTNVTVPADPMTRCNYTLGTKTPGVPDSGVPDAATPIPDAATPVPDASKPVPDASKPGQPDGGKPAEAGISDAAPSGATTG